MLAEHDAAESPWDEDGDFGEIEWTKFSSDFTNAGYREGITAGKEAAVQEGFDAGFAEIGVPIGRELGMLRGFASAFLAFLGSAHSSGFPDRESNIAEARDIASRLADVRLTDIAPPDLEAEEHARLHLEGEDEIQTDEQLALKQKMEKIEDMFVQLNAGTSSSGTNNRPRPTIHDVRQLSTQLRMLCEKLGLNI